MHIVKGCFKNGTSTKENQTEKTMEHDMAHDMIQGFIRIKVSKIRSPFCGLYDKDCNKEWYTLGPLHLEKPPFDLAPTH